MAIIYNGTNLTSLKFGDTQLSAVYYCDTQAGTCTKVWPVVSVTNTGGDYYTYYCCRCIVRPSTASYDLGMFCMCNCHVSNAYCSAACLNCLENLNQCDEYCIRTDLEISSVTVDDNCMKDLLENYTAYTYANFCKEDAGAHSTIDDCYNNSSARSCSYSVSIDSSLTGAFISLCLANRITRRATSGSDTNLDGYWELCHISCNWCQCPVDITICYTNNTSETISIIPFYSCF